MNFLKEEIQMNKIIKIENENGTALQLPDGTMICYGAVITGNYDETMKCSEVYWTYPVKFKSEPKILFAKAKGGTYRMYGELVSTVENTQLRVQLKSLDSKEITYIDSSKRPVSVMAIGIWK